MQVVGGANERLLFHGTNESNVETIISQGFLRDFNTTSAFGKGTYFATDAAYSLRPSYASPNAAGEQTLFVARVICGESCLGCRNKLTPDLKPGLTVLYESMVDSLVSPRIYVLSAGSDYHSYPEFLLRVYRKPMPPGAMGGTGMGMGLLDRTCGWTHWPGLSCPSGS